MACCNAAAPISGYKYQRSCSSCANRIQEIDKPLRTVNKKVIAKLLGFNSVEAFDEWHDGKLYKPFWTEFHERCILPLREEAERSGKPRTRLFKLVTVEDAVRAGEGRGRVKYSGHADKDSYSTVDWYAHILCWTQKENSRWFDGVFFSQKHLNEHQKYCLLWTVIQYDLYRTSKSRMELVAGRKRRAEQQKSDNPNKKQRSDKIDTTATAMDNGMRTDDGEQGP